jgi:hypothetical protein
MIAPSIYPETSYPFLLDSCQHSSDG